MYSSWYNPNKKNPIRSAKAIPKRKGTEIMNTMVSGSAGIGQNAGANYFSIFKLTPQCQTHKKRSIKSTQIMTGIPLLSSKKV